MNVTDTPQTDTTQTEGAGPVVVAVAIVSADGVLGDGTDQPWHLREDQKRFKDLTRGHPVVVGRATFDTFGGPLPGRPHVVVTRDRDWSYPGVRVAHDPHEAPRMAKELPGGDERVGIIGGGQIYEALLPQTDVVELTEVDADARRREDRDLGRSGREVVGLAEAILGPPWRQVDLGGDEASGLARGD